jgi:ligand-binding SRPBCC domain-containing protein
MWIYRLHREQLVTRPVNEVFAFFSRARNLELITPSWLRFEVLTAEPIEMAPGTLIEYRLWLHGVSLRWTSRIEEFETDRGFVDRQLRGPYRFWQHRHDFVANRAGTLVRDDVRYVLPFGPLGQLLHALVVRRDLQRIFDHRREAVATALARPARSGRSRWTLQ